MPEQWKIDERKLADLPALDREFFFLETAGMKTPDYYVQRLRALGFTGLETMLDAACGVGQWTVAMSRLNRFVCAVDLNPTRLAVAAELSKSMAAHNIFLQLGSMEALPYREGYFDACFCYGAVMFTRVRTTLREFARVLKPGGRLYLNFNALGWYLHLIVDRGLKGRDGGVLIQALRMVARTLTARESNIVLSLRKMESYLLKEGFRVIEASSEGGLNVTGVPSAPPAYQARNFGFPSVVEILAEKGEK